MSNSNCVSIPIIPYGLRQEETIVQIIAALENIDFVVTDVFQQIEKNIQRHREYLLNLQKRSEIVAAKVDNLAGKNVTTTVYSHYKFPAQEHSMDTLFKLNLQAPQKKEYPPIRSKFQHSKYNKTLNKLHFFHVKSNSDTTQDSSLVSAQGLGDIPAEIESVSSLLLFNTSVNLYSKYVMIDPLAVGESKSSEVEEEKKTDIADAPKSITNIHSVQNDDYFSCFYTPAFEEVPGIDTPADLPDLPGIAGDLKFNLYSETPIAPSKRSQEIDKSKSLDEITISDLPVISKSKTIVLNREIPKSADINVTNNAFSNACTSDQINTELSSLPHQPPIPIVMPPPPPPPMPVEEIIKEEKTDSTIPHNCTLVQKTSNPNENMHANLMEAIRKAGGKEKAKLRQVDQTDNEKIPDSKENKDVFMNDLYAALARRRKGISGQIKNDKNISMMDRVSAMITPTTPEESDDNTEDEANDWDE